MPTIDQIVQQIRTAVYGREVRENIALGIEQCYSDVTEGQTLIEYVGGPMVDTANNALEMAQIADTKSTNAVSTANQTNESVMNMTGQATSIDAGEEPTINISNVNGHKHLAFGIPRGMSASITNCSIMYHVSDNGTVHPDDDDGNWTANPPQTVAGDYLWIRVTLSWSTDEEDTVFYLVSRNGSDGDGSFTIGLGSEYTFSPDANSKITLPLDEIPQDDSAALITSGGVFNAMAGVTDEVSALSSNLAYVESGATAVNNIPNGQFVIWNRLLYTAKEEIEIGDTLSTNNLEPVSGGGLNTVTPKVINTLEELRDIVSATPTIPVLMNLVNGSEAQIVLSSGNIYSTDPGEYATCVAKYQSQTIIDCVVFTKDNFNHVRYNPVSGEIDNFNKYIPSNGLFKYVEYTWEWKFKKNQSSQSRVKYGTMDNLVDNDGHSYAEGIPGYEKLAIGRFYTGSNAVMPYFINGLLPSASGNVFGVYKTSSANDLSSDVSGTMVVGIVYVKQGCFAS